MKKPGFILFLLLLNAMCAFSQNYNWITPNQIYLKMYLADEGMYRINKSDFVTAGINADVIDPRTVKVYYKGTQAPIFFYGEQDGIFNDTDYFDFYGHRNYGGLTNTYNSDNQVFYVTDEYNNLYSDTSAYWIGWGGAFGTRFTNSNYNSSIPYPLNYFYKKNHFERDLLYSYGENINDQDYRYFSNEKFQGEGWFWMTMQFQNTISQNFTSPVLSSSAPCKLKIFAYPVTQSPTVTYEHRLVTRVNNIIIDTLFSNHFNRIDTTVYFPSSMLLPSGSNSSSVKYVPHATFVNEGAYLNFDMYEISYPRGFDFDSNKVSFNTESTDTVSKIFKLKGFVSVNEINIYDVKNGYRITNYSLSSDTLVFTGKGNGQFEVINKPIIKKPFRIKQKQVPDLLSGSNGVDYLVVYNKLFVTQAEQLRAYRNTHDNFRSVKAEIEDIYDIFNYGIENPVAVRNFVKYVFDIWQAPKVKYICLFGRASLDPKKNVTTSVYFQNFIPAYGNPPSDGYFSNLIPGTFTYCPQISIGRLPAYTTQEAQDLVNKIIAYENQPLDKWVKNFSFFTGGYDRNTQLQFMNQSNSYISSFIDPPPLSGYASKVFINDTNGLLTFNYSDSIKNSLNRGTFFANYIGHSSNGYWDYTFTDPNVLSNGTKLPIIYSGTCFTGKNSEASYRGYGEEFVLYPNKGAIGFVGTTGWSFWPGGGNTLNGYFLAGLSVDSIRRMGDILRFAETAMYPDSSSFVQRNTINSYNLIGDPALKLKLPTIPEFDIQNSDYQLSNAYPSLKENITLSIFPKNLGTKADSCKIRLQILKNNLSHSIKDTVVYNWKFIDTIKYYFILDSVGSYSAKINLDIDNWVPLENKSNNIVTIPLSIRDVAYTPLKPIDNSVIKTDTVEFVGINPNIDVSKNSVKLLLQLDTTKLFNSPMNQVYFNNNMLGAATKFRLRIPILDSNIVYYWRLNVIKNNIDTLGWSEIKRFVYNAGITNFENKHNITQTDSIILVYKNKAKQFNDFETSNLNFDNTGAKISSFTGNIIASCWGGAAWEPSYMAVNNYYKYFILDNYDWNGLYMFKVNKVNAIVVDQRHIFMTTSSSSDSVYNFLNTIDSSYILMAVKLIPYPYPPFFPLNSNARNKLTQLGSLYADTLNFANWDRWSFISYKGLPSPVTDEKYNRTDWVPQTCSMTPTFNYLSGSISNNFGPAKTWKNFSWGQTLFPGTTIKFDVIGIDRNNNENILFSNLVTNNFVDLQSINAYQYPNLKLIAKLNIDTLTGTKSPVFQNLKFNYIPPAEIAMDYNTFIKSDSLLNSGDSLGISMTYYNVGYFDNFGVIRNIFVNNNTGQKIILKSDTITTTLKIDSLQIVKTQVKLSNIQSIRKYNNYILLNYEIQPLGQQNDYYYYNNIVTTNVVVKSNPQIVNLEIFSDGVKLSGGEYVRSKPNLEIKYTDKNLPNISNFDTTSFKIFINSTYFPYSLQSNGGITIECSKDNSRGNVKLKLNPAFQNGENSLKFLSKKSDGNGYDTLKYSVMVTNDLTVKDFYNYPNPMKNQTVFYFNLGGNSTSFGYKIKIFTVSGRLIKTLNGIANLGFNNIQWEGKDNDGDYIANGVYFYKMNIDGDASMTTSVQKLVILK